MSYNYTSIGKNTDILDYSSNLAYGIASQGRYLITSGTFSTANTYGKINIFKKNGNSWNFHQNIESKYYNGNFGRYNAIYGDYAAISDSGSNKLCIIKNNSGTWEDVTEIDCNYTIEGALSMNENFVVFGDYAYKPGAVMFGKVTIMKNNGGVFSVSSTILGNATDIGGGNGAYFGKSVKIDGNYLAVSASGMGKIFIFKKNDNDDTFVQLECDSGGNKFIERPVEKSEWWNPYNANLDPSPTFGNAINLKGNYLIVGSPTSGGYGFGGAAFIYKKDSNDHWSPLARLTPEYPTPIPAGFSYGTDTKLNSKYAYIYYNAKIDSKTAAGSISVYKLSDFDTNPGFDEKRNPYVSPMLGDLTYHQDISSNTPVQNENFGRYFDINGEFLFAGATGLSPRYFQIFKSSDPEISNAVTISGITDSLATSTSKLLTNTVDAFFGNSELTDFTQTESNTLFTDLSNNTHTKDIMAYIAFKIIKANSSMSNFAINSLYNSLNTINKTLTFDNLLESTKLTIFDASNNADISGGDVTPTSIEKDVFKGYKELSFRKYRKNIKGTELETKIKDISTADVDANIETYLTNINANLSLNLTGMDLSGLDLSNTDLSGATLVNTDLSGANLTNAILQGIDLSATNLNNVNLLNATFEYSTNSTNSIGKAINVPYTHRYEKYDNIEKLYQTTENLSIGSYVIPSGTVGPFKDGESIVINGIEVVFGGGVSEAGLLGVNENAAGQAFAFLQEDNNITGWGNIYKGGNISTDVSNVTAVYSTNNAKAAICENGRVFTWGISGEGGNGPADLSGVIDIQANEKAFCALLYDGTITCWGDTNTGGTTPADISNVIQIYSNNNAFTALSANGSVKSWGSLNGTAPTTTNFVDVYNTNTAFAGLKADGSVACWGSADAAQNTVPADVSNVSIIYSNETAFAAQIDNGTVMCWGNANNGGTTPNDISNVDMILNTNTAFSALLHNGNVVSWGNAANGGAAPADISNVNMIVSTQKAFAAITKNETVISWGDNNYGGNNVDVSMCANIHSIYSTDRAFAAVSKYGDITVWGDNDYGGNPVDVSGQDEIIHVFSTKKAFMALKKDKTQISWGDGNFGALGTPTTNINISHNIQDVHMHIEAYRKSNIRSLYNIHYDTRKLILNAYTSNAQAQILLNSNGTVTAWGNSVYGGDTTNIAGSLTNIKEIIPGNKIMTALKSDGTLISWGDLSNNIADLNNVKKVVNDSSGLTIVLKANGDVSANHIDLTSWDLCGNVPNNNLSNLNGIIDIFPSNNCFAALRYDGALYLWGKKDNSTTRPLHNITKEASKLTSNVKEVIINGNVMIALKYDGTVVTTGDIRYGGDISNNNAQYKLYGGTADNITEVFLNDKFAVALKKDNSCVYWGDISRNATLFNYNISTFTDIKTIVYSKDVMVGLTYEGAVVGLGEKTKGSEIHLPKDVQKIYATTNNGFTALKNDGTIVVWGDNNYGGQL